MAVKNGKKQTSFTGLDVIARDRVRDAVIRFDQVSAAPTTTSGHRYLYVNSSNQLIFDSGSTTLNLSTTVAGAGNTLDSAYDNGASITLDASTITITQTLNDTGLNLNKTGTGAGTPLLVQNAGSGDDIQVISTRAGAAGVVVDFAQNSASPAAADVIFEGQFNGYSSTSVAREYARLRVIAATVTNASEVGTVQFAMMVAGTSRTVLDITGDLMIYGSGQANAVMSSSGANDLILETNSGTNSGTIRIYDGSNGNIEVDANGTGDLTLPSTGIVQGGTAATRCTFAVGGTTGQGFDIVSSTITSGDVLRVNHSASGTLSGGNLLNLAIDGTAYYSFGEVAMTVAGTGGSTVLAVTAGDAVFSDGSLALTDADNANTFSVTNNTATSVSVIDIAGSGVFTGVTTSSFMEVSASGLTTGTLLRLVAAAATTSVGVVDIATAGLTTGSAFRVTGSGATLQAGGKCIEIAMGAATVGQGLDILTSGVYSGTGVVNITANSATTGTGILLTMNGLTTGTGMTITSTGTIATTGELLSLIGNSATTATALLRISGTGLTDGFVEELTGGGANFSSSGGMANWTMGAATVGAGLAIVTSGVYTGAGLIQLQANSATTGVIQVITANGLTTGTMLRLISTGTIVTTGEMLEVTANTATTCTGLVRISGTGLTDGVAVNVTSGGANMTASGDLFLLSMGAATVGNGIDLTTTGVYTGTGVVLLTANSATSGKGVVLSMTGATSGVGIEVTGGGVNMTSGGVVIDAIMGAATTGIGLRVATTGAYTGSTGIVDINAASATTGTIVDIGIAALTTGIGLNIGDANALTTGSCARFISNSSDTTSRALVQITNDNSAAAGAIPIQVQNDGVQSTNYRRVMKESASGITLWWGNGTTANGNLSGTAGDLILNAGSNKPEYCTGTTNWTALV